MQKQQRKFKGRLMSRQFSVGYQGVRDYVGFCRAVNTLC